MPGDPGEPQKSAGEGPPSGYALPLSQRTYADLKRLAMRHIRKRNGADSMDTTSLVHEAYERIGRRAASCNSRSHFLAIASRAMWQILVDHARARAARKRGGDRLRVAFNASDLLHAPRALDVLVLDDVISRLKELDSLQGELVHLRFFADLSMEEIADTLGISKWKAEEEWRHARAWLRKEIDDAVSR